ncbi:hypothetical protein COR50_20150 [Chitinophaga caeni]|uniref:SHOCT domain-containing protein n=1 Tax=Chitinophaga caeni TaxID=2029983 RepID=A0A291QZB7_9BACT|nr:SHOCT domain-containing protein [Chitinophaga caeni]ATL49300.1 hypothetical protein COR50_20150 [Chitinophaga caeni]
MKRILIVLTIMILIKKSYSQDLDSSLPRIVNDTLFATCGYKIVKGQDIKIGMGTMPDGDFKFIRRKAGSLFAYYSTTGYQGQANAANAFPRSQSGLKYRIKSVEKRGNKKRGYVYYAKIGFGIVNFEIDVENAIAKGEIWVPDEFRPNPTQEPIKVELKQQISIADELTKLKKLYDDGVLTKEEFEMQKKKLLEGK